MDYAYLEKWNLIEAGQDNGYWKITQRGKEFVEDDIDLPDHCLVYNGNVYKFGSCKIIAATTYSLQLDIKLNNAVITKAGEDKGKIIL